MKTLSILSVYAMINFCHLHTHNEFSILDGLGTADQYCDKALSINQQYLSITNHGNIDGLINFQNACQKKKIKPILGCEAYIVPDLTVKLKNEKRQHVILLIKNQEGYENLCQMLTIANLQGFYHRPRISYGLLLERCNGLIIATACASSFINTDDGIKLFWQLYDRIQDDLYLEIMPHQLEDQLKVNRICRELKKKNSKLKFIGSNDAHYVNKEDEKTHEVLLAIQSKKKWDDPNRFKFNLSGLYLKSYEEMISAFEEQKFFKRSEYLPALENTIEVAEKCCNFTIKKRAIDLPLIPEIRSNKESADDFLWELCLTNGEKLFKKEYKDWPDGYYDRLKEEFDLIEKKKFSRYFLIVYEMINWAKQNDIMAGCGRGSAGGSLMAYILGITAIDPLKFNLLFSRFISEERQDFPDIDIDFMDSRRDEVRKHLEELYGQNNIAGVSTFLTMKGRMALRDAARVFDIPNNEVNTFCNCIDDSLQDDKTQHNLIKDAVEKTEEGKAFCRKYPEIVDYAKKLEGQTRATGSHAAAVVISNTDLTEGKSGCLINRNNTTVINWDMDDCQYAGLIKLDLLGLSTLTVLDEALRLVKQNHGKVIDLNNLNLENKQVLKEFANGNTIGVFQFNSHGITKLCKDMRVNCFEDLIAINALYRPGTLRSGLIDVYLERKNGKRYTIHPIIKEITKNTYGVIIYQEQVMQLVNRLAGMSWKDADKIRKVIAKSKGKKELLKFKEQFVNGCVENNTMNNNDASDTFDMLEEFGGYQFNRSHSVCYSMIAYQCMFLKYYYPTEFISASLTYSADSKIEELAKEAYRLGLSIITPKIGKSDPKRWIAKENKLYIPFCEIKGIGDKTAEDIQNRKPKKEVKKLKGFFITNNSISIKKKKSKLDETLEELKVFTDEECSQEVIKKYFSFEINNDKTKLYPNLIKLISNKDIYIEDDFEDILKGKAGIQGFIKNKRYTEKDVIECNLCELRKECTAPVVSSKGLYNIAIIGEAPGANEDKEKMSFVGDAGELLWNEISKYGFSRIDFFISNACRCYPKESKTPNKEQIDICSRWVLKELEKNECRLILSLGSSARYLFTGQEQGMLSANGNIEWSEKVKAWVCYVVHPSYILRNKNKEDIFKYGIKEFINLIKRFGVELL